MPDRLALIRGVSRPLSAEMELAAACSAWPPTPRIDERIAATAGCIADWATFGAAVRKHRVTPLVHHALARNTVALPNDLRSSLLQRSRTMAAQSLMQAAECSRIQRAFDDAGLESLIVKGIPLAMMSYAELGLKQPGDIDLVVRPDSLAQPIRLLGELGYRMEFPITKAAQLARLIWSSKEVGFRHPARGHFVDLHWRLVDSPQLMKPERIFAATQLVPIPGGSLLRTLADEALFAHLCLHGAAHNWFRLKWLADLNAFMNSRGEDMARIYAAAKSYQADTSAAVAVALCERLFGTPSPVPERRNAIARVLQANALMGLDAARGTAELTRFSPLWWRVMAAFISVVPNPRIMLSQTGTLWNSAPDPARLALPRPLHFAYHLLRLPLWLKRRLARSRRAS